MKQVRFKHLFHLVSILCILHLFSNNYWAWIELTLTEEVNYSVKNVIRYYSVLKNDSRMTTRTLSNSNLIYVFFFLFLLTNLLLIQKHVIVVKIGANVLFSLLFTFSMFISSSYEPCIKTKNVIVVKKWGGGSSSSSIFICLRRLLNMATNESWCGPAAS